MLTTVEGLLPLYWRDKSMCGISPLVPAVYPGLVRISRALLLGSQPIETHGVAEAQGLVREVLPQGSFHFQRFCQILLWQLPQR